MINKNRLLRLTQDVVRINSENPPGQERQIARFVATFLRSFGARPEFYAFAKGRDNVMAVLKGRKKGGGRALLITPHLDTVPAGGGWRYGAFSGQIVNGKIYGRGTTDCKGNLAVAMEVVASLLEARVSLDHDVIFLATADEETGSKLGLVPLLDKKIVRPSVAVILDSDEFNIITAQKGLIHLKVTVPGKKAHGAYPDRGVNAIDRAMTLIGAFKQKKWMFRPHPLLKSPTMNIGTIRGGDKVNMVADWCELEVDLRFLPGMDAEQILGQLREMARRLGIPARLTVNDIQKPYEIQPAHLLVKSLVEATYQQTGLRRIRGSEGATVITFFQKHKIPAVATGYGASGCAHATDEFVRVRDLCRGAVVLERFIQDFDRAR